MEEIEKRLIHRVRVEKRMIRLGTLMFGDLGRRFKEGCGVVARSQWVKLMGSFSIV